MRTALIVFAAVLAALTALTFAVDGEAGAGDVLLNAVAAATATATVQYGRSEPGGPLRREGIIAGVVTLAVLVVIITQRLA